MTGGGSLSADEERALREELKRLEAAVEQHRALIVSQQMEELDRAVRWYAKNASECLRVIEALNHDGLGYRLLAADEVPFGDEGDEYRGYITELGRTWHNFVASAQSLDDHMWHQFKEEQPADLRSEYLAKRKELLGPHDVTAFVSRSRNVLLHRGVFNTGFTYRFTQTMAHLADSTGRRNTSMTEVCGGEFEKALARAAGGCAAAVGCGSGAAARDAVAGSA